MSLPVVAIVGRPNVGKSSLLNCLAGKRIAIVDPTPGVTRDRISVPLAVADGYIELVDTGGIGIEHVDNLTEHVEEQISYAIAAASLILFVVDAREGLMPLDRHVAGRLRRQNKPVILLANKIDQSDLVAEIAELHKLGFGEPLRVSARHKLGRGELLEAIAERLGVEAHEAAPEPVMKLAIVGKRNAGKSTFVNALAGEQRVIVSESPGTTRDSVDVAVEMDGRPFVFIDTAGLRKRRKISGDVEFYSIGRAMRAIRRADVVAFMIDASVPISQVDKKLAGQIAEQFKPIVLVVNKWDLVKDLASGEDYAEYLAKTFPLLSFAPISLTSATEGLNIRQTIRLAEQLYDQAATRVPTARINNALRDILKLRGPSHKAGTKPPKILYASQVSTCPPTVVCFVNDLRSFDESYRRFMLNQFRQRLEFAEVPIRLLFRPRRPNGK